jgi:hypothetical protein
MSAKATRLKFVDEHGRVIISKATLHELIAKLLDANYEGSCSVGKLLSAELNRFLFREGFRNYFLLLSALLLELQDSLRGIRRTLQG